MNMAGIQGENRILRIRQGGRIEGVMPSVMFLAGGRGKTTQVCMVQGGRIAGVRIAVIFFVF